VVRFARLIQRRGRDLGGPVVRAACGGNPSLPWWPLKMVRQNQDYPQLSSPVLHSRLPVRCTFGSQSLAMSQAPRICR
jgi:hypothetical protein